MDIAVRGNVLEFSTSFFDAADAPVNPASVALKLRVASPGVTTQPDPIELAMVRVGSTDVWAVQWDTSGIPMGTVFWAVQSTTPHSADEGNFELTANAANVWA